MIYKAKTPYKKNHNINPSTSILLVSHWNIQMEYNNGITH
jgi:hypothetical protein